MTSALCLRLQGRRHSAASYPSLLGIKKSRTENQKRNSRPLCLCPRPVCPCRSPPLRCASLLPSPASTSTLPLTQPWPPPASTCCLPAPVLLLALFLPLHPLLLATSLMLFSFYHTVTDLSKTELAQEHSLSSHTAAAVGESAQPGVYRAGPSSPQPAPGAETPLPSFLRDPFGQSRCSGHTSYDTASVFNKQSRLISV